MSSHRSMVAAIALAATALATPAFAAEADAVDKGAFGVGLIIGEPAGISLKLYLGEESNTAIAAAVGFAFAADGLHAHVDYLWHPWILTTEDKFVLPAYMGLGLRVLDHRRQLDNDDFHVGVRGSIGMVFDFKTIPIDAFAEVALVMDYRTGGGDPDHDNLGPDLNASIGVRYYF